MTNGSPEFSTKCLLRFIGRFEINAGAGFLVGNPEMYQLKSYKCFMVPAKHFWYRILPLLRSLLIFYFSPQLGVGVDMGNN